MQLHGADVPGRQQGLGGGPSTRVSLGGSEGGQEVLGRPPPGEGRS